MAWLEEIKTDAEAIFLLGDLFDNIYLISNTAGNDDSSRFLVDHPNVHVYESYSDEIIRNINEAKKNRQ